MLLKQPENNFTSSTSGLDCDLVIVGGGIVGATLAAALKNSGLEILIIEARPLEVAAAKKQAYSFSLLSSQIYQGIGVWEEIYPRVGKYNHIRLSDADYQQQVKFDTQDLNTEHLGYVAQHNVVLTTLQKHLANCSCVNWLSPAEVMEVKTAEDYSTVQVKVDGQPN